MRSYLLCSCLLMVFSLVLWGCPPEEGEPSIPDDDDTTAADDDDTGSDDDDSAVGDDDDSAVGDDDDSAVGDDDDSAVGDDDDSAVGDDDDSAAGDDDDSTANLPPLRIADVDWADGNGDGDWGVAETLSISANLYNDSTSTLLSVGAVLTVDNPLVLLVVAADWGAVVLGPGASDPLSFSAQTIGQVPVGTDITFTISPSTPGCEATGNNCPPDNSVSFTVTLQ